MKAVVTTAAYPASPSARQVPRSRTTGERKPVTPGTVRRRPGMARGGSPGDSPNPTATRRSHHGRGYRRRAGRRPPRPGAGRWRARPPPSPRGRPRPAPLRARPEGTCAERPWSPARSPRTAAPAATLPGRPCRGSARPVRRAGQPRGSGTPALGSTGVPLPRGCPARRTGLALPLHGRPGSVAAGAAVRGDRAGDQGRSAQVPSGRARSGAGRGRPRGDGGGRARHRPAPGRGGRRPARRRYPRPWWLLRVAVGFGESPGDPPRAMPGRRRTVPGVTVFRSPVVRLLGICLALGLAGYAAVVTTAFVWRNYIREAGAIPLPPFAHDDRRSDVSQRPAGTPAERRLGPDRRADPNPFA